MDKITIIYFIAVILFLLKTFLYYVLYRIYLFIKRVGKFSKIYLLDF